MLGFSKVPTGNQPTWLAEGESIGARRRRKSDGFGASAQDNSGDQAGSDAKLGVGTRCSL